MQAQYGSEQVCFSVANGTTRGSKAPEALTLEKIPRARCCRVRMAVQPACATMTRGVTNSSSSSSSSNMNLRSVN
eukprot:4667857-Pleurochrysis_carterae.AAC.2